MGRGFARRSGASRSWGVGASGSVTGTGGRDRGGRGAGFGRKPIVGIASIGIDDEHRWKDSVTTAAELRTWLADGIANGLRPWVAKFSGVVYDPRWLGVVEKVYDWHRRNESYLRNEENLA